jgi:ubiquinone biosynthesis protein UbiJ
MFDQAFLAALNHLLEGANWARARLAPFAGRQARIEMPPFNFGFEIDEDGRVRQNPDPDATDVVIRLPADTPFLLPQGLDKVMAAATVEGNAEFATELSFVFRNLRWDAEEDLSKLVGDIAAHRLVEGANRFMAWQKQAAANLAENLAEYLVHEKPLLVATTEFTAFREDITRLNADLTRLEARSKTLA